MCKTSENNILDILNSMGIKFDDDSPFTENPEFEEIFKYEELVGDKDE